MEAELYTRTNKIREKPVDVSEKAVHSTKLHNESTMTDFYGRKLRTKKADNALTEEEIKKSKQLKRQSVRKIRADAAAEKKARKLSETQNKDNSTAYEVIDDGVGAVCGVSRKIKYGIYKKQLKQRQELKEVSNNSSKIAAAQKEYRKKSTNGLWDLHF